MSIIQYITNRFNPFEKLSDWRFVEKRHTQNTEYIKSTAIETEIMFDNGDKTIGRDGRIDLDFNCILSNSPKGFYVQMLLNPFKKLMRSFT